MTHKLEDVGRRQINFINRSVREVIPEHFTSDYPDLVKFLEYYYDFLDSDGQSSFSTEIHQLFTLRDITETPTEYLNSDHSYPIPVHKQLNRDGTGEPNVTACTELMKHVYKNQHEARQKGKLAASFVNKNLSPNVIGEKVVKKLEEYLYLL